MRAISVLSISRVPRHSRRGERVGSVAWTGFVRTSSSSVRAAPRQAEPRARRARTRRRCRALDRRDDPVSCRVDPLTVSHTARMSACSPSTRPTPFVPPTTRCSDCCSGTTSKPPDTAARGRRTCDPSPWTRSPGASCARRSGPSARSRHASRRNGSHDCDEGARRRDRRSTDGGTTHAHRLPGTVPWTSSSRWTCPTPARAVPDRASPGGGPGWP